METACKYLTKAMEGARKAGLAGVGGEHWEDLERLVAFTLNSEGPRRSTGQTVQTGGILVKLFKLVEYWSNCTNWSNIFSKMRVVFTWEI